MRLKRHRDSLRPLLPRPRDDFMQHVRVRPMYAIEVAHADQRRPKISRNVVEFMKNLHRRKLGVGRQTSDLRRNRSLRTSGFGLPVNATITLLDRSRSDV